MKEFLNIQFTEADLLYRISPYSEEQMYLWDRSRNKWWLHLSI